MTEPQKSARGFRAVTYNVAGAKLLELPERLLEPHEQPTEKHKKHSMTRGEYRDKLHRALYGLTHPHDPEDAPDVILLQEVVKFGDPENPVDLIQTDQLPGYCYDASIAISTKNQSHPQKWDKYFDFIDVPKTKRNWELGTYLAQGYGILWRKDLEHAPIWEFEARSGPTIAKEIVRLETGLFTGSRDTEPRLAVVTHFVIKHQGADLDIFVVNLHLTTLKGEREGSPDKDAAASKVRRTQLDVVLNGIISRYNEWVSGAIEKERKKKVDFKRRPAVWVLGGDFNCIEASPEIVALKQLNFIDLNPNKGDGTKGTEVPIETASITLDYLFAGPAYYSIDPYLAEKQAKSNPLPLEYRVSDHLPVQAKVPILPK